MFAKGETSVASEETRRDSWRGFFDEKDILVTNTTEDIV